MPAVCIIFVENYMTKIFVLFDNVLELVFFALVELNTMQKLNFYE